ncbi:prolipoprotein diacylglyceryl transferase [Rhizobacter sp. Root1221]|uniref:prolipoprotein diacylglyceryl transferase n=1 Tax=Rhizobacter sp. Root1221 TaxID=1736433 RepID=UPI0006FB631D|nr:prolipoprotein diacylglyceryl transferase [Rhizobacter sp. Root1221]KQV99478.1 diacylglyceryl transferase [Rhizobacter sp. Root1221]
MSYPYLSDALKALTGLDIPLPLPTFGLCVVGAMLVATVFFRRELQRLRLAGELRPVKPRPRDDSPLPVEDKRGLDEFVSTFACAVLISGVLGARIFHIFEHLPQFLADPWPMIFSRSGLSIMGGLIVGTFAGIWVVWRSGLPLRPVLDAAAPTMMIGYGLGRIGCQISGDGDWGTVANMALKPDWLPTWLWAQTYDNNIYGVVIPAPGVYPAPIYETTMALLLFGLLWAVRRHPFSKGWLFAVYLLLAGAERLLIEQIRVNPVLEFIGVRATQAEMISGVFIVLGLAGIALLSRRSPPAGKPVPA